MAVVTISRQFGAHGWMLAENLANRMNYQLVSREVINEMAREAKVSVDWIESVEKEAGGRLMRMVSKLVSSDYIDRHIGETRHDFNEDLYMDFLKELIPRIASKDNVVILGRGCQFILPNSSNTIKVFLAAHMEDRITFIEEEWEISREEAEQIVTSREKRRRAFLKRIDPHVPDDPGLYHLTLNMSHISVEYAEDIIVGLIERAGKTEK